MKPSRYATTLRAQCKLPWMTMILEHRIETFDAANSGGVGWHKDRAAYHLYLLDTEAPIARLKPAGTKDEVRIGYCSHRKT